MLGEKTGEGTEKLCLEVREAMAGHELKAFYQPKFNAVTGRVTGAEALVRWIKSDGKMVPPGDFIPQLEQSEDILAVDWYMLREVCAFLKLQRDELKSSVSVAVNFSRMHINEPDYIETLCKTVDSYGIPHHLIEVEITESAFVDDSSKIADWIGSIRDKGFRVAIDDFGSGLSSLSFVKDITVDVLKIDKSLISRNCEDEKERIVLESIFNFAHRLKLTTVAEGVETKEQLGFLRACDCKVIQGFLFAKPMPEQDFMELCREEDAKDDDTDHFLELVATSATQMLLDVIFTQYPLIIFSNLTRNSFYFMEYENFTTKDCPTAGVFEELIESGASTMHPEDRELFRNTFSIPNLMAAHNRGEKSVSVVTRQLGDDGIYRRVESTDYFVKNPSTDDVMVITLSHSLD